MPVVEKDPWRLQYFETVVCPDDIVIPTDDEDAYRLYPLQRWVYNKLLICETQGLEHGPHGIPPAHFPVFSKPIFNLRGMGMGGCAIASLAEYEEAERPGHLWMPLLAGEHVSTDVAVVDGLPLWWRHTTGAALEHGMFDYWTVMAEARPALEEYCGRWLPRHLRGYTGLVNFETIGGVIIECHLRFADQWVDLYGTGWLASVVELYARGRWDFADRDRHTGYSVVLFGQHGLRLPASDPTVVDACAPCRGVSSIQITFHPTGRRVARHAAGRLPPRDRQLLGSRRRSPRPRAARHCLRDAAACCAP